MNLADYLSELLAQQNEVSIPGLGYFVRTRVNAQYNSAEGRFYPPYHQVNFVAQPKDDDIFAQYVADKKNISLASSKYFIEKFVARLKEEAAKGRYLFADIGSFRAEFDQLIFKPNDKIHADPAFYGYPALDIVRLNQAPGAGQRNPVAASAATPRPSVQPPVSEQSAEPEVRLSHQPQYYEEEVEPKRRMNVWVVILIIIAIIGAAVFGIYKFDHSLFEKAKTEFYKITGKTTATPAVIRKPVAADSVTKSLPVSDTAAKSVSSTALADTVKTSRYEAIAFELRPRWAANAKLKELKAKGYDAYIDSTSIGDLFKVVLGPYPDFKAADSTEKALIKIGVIKKHYYPIEVQQ